MGLLDPLVGAMGGRGALWEPVPPAAGQATAVQVRASTVGDQGWGTEGWGLLLSLGTSEALLSGGGGRGAEGSRAEALTEKWGASCGPLPCGLLTEAAAWLTCKWQTSWHWRSQQVSVTDL